MKRDIEFAVEDGTILRGVVHTPADGPPRPAIVMAHGFSGIKEQLGHYAAAFAEAGFAVLLYDHRSFGASDGVPRYEVDPAAQIADWRDAITVALRLPEVDASRPVGVFGSSFAGGLAMVVAAVDSRVGPVVSQIPNVSGRANAPLLFGPERIETLRAMLVDDRGERLDGREAATVPVFSDDPTVTCALPSAVDMAWIDLTEQKSSWRNVVTLRSVEHLLSFEPAAWLPSLRDNPFLMIIGETDDCTFPAPQRDAFELAPEPKKLVVHEGGHFDTYTTHFAVAGGAARDWFVEHLPVG
ncbi:alpha/beta hydrolase [Rhodococcus sp. NPDC003994]